MTKYFIFSFLLMSVKVWSSAECSKSSHTNKALGRWEISLVDIRKNEVPLFLIVKNDGHFFGGSMTNKDKSKSLKVQPCEGDCCNGFSKSNGTLNFWSKDSNNFLGKTGRLTLRFDKIDWSKGIASGELRDQSWEKISDFKAKKIKPSPKKYCIGVDNEKMPLGTKWFFTCNTDPKTKENVWYRYCYIGKDGHAKWSKDYTEYDPKGC